MSNYHLRDKNLSLKAKGLLSQMLSLPEDWDYTLAGLARISLEGKDAIRAAISMAERRHRCKDSALPLARRCPHFVGRIAYVDKSNM